jgi:hypothetical protein
MKMGIRGRIFDDPSNREHQKIFRIDHFAHGIFITKIFICRRLVDATVKGAFKAV